MSPHGGALLIVETERGSWFKVSADVYWDGDGLE